MYTLFAFMPFYMGACADIGSSLDPSVVTDTKPVNAAIDEEKLISQGIESPQDPRTMNDPTYSISNTSRLLIRFGKFLSDAGNILDEQPILLRLEVSDADTTAALKDLQVCPITKNWMMYASWSKAHPYKNGNWDHPGGDIDFVDCFSGLDAADPALKNQEEKDFCSDKKAICFNVLPYFKSFVQARNSDNGLAVVNQNGPAVNIYGKTTLKGPVLFWRKLRY